MADRRFRYRHVTVTCFVAEEEHRRLRAICDALKIPVRQVLMTGVLRCERTYAEELRRQRQLDED